MKPQICLKHPPNFLIKRKGGLEGGRKEKGKEKKEKKRKRKKRHLLEAEINEYRIQLLLRAGKQCLEFESSQVNKDYSSKEHNRIKSPHCTFLYNQHPIINH